MNALFDPSAFAMLVLEDPGWYAPRGYIARERPDGRLSDFGWGEFVSAVSLRVRLGVTTAERAASSIADAKASTASWLREAITSADVEQATAFVHRFDLMLKLPDAIHIATARRLGCLLVTADRRQATAAQTLGLPIFNPYAEAPLP